MSPHPIEAFAASRPGCRYWAVPVVVPGFRADDPVRWYVVPVGYDGPAPGNGWATEADAVAHAVRCGLPMADE
jgi:hypothetical protein